MNGAGNGAGNAIAGEAGSAREVLVAGIVAALRAAPAMAGCAVFDAPPVRGGLPLAVVEEPVLADWSASGLTGREGRLTVTIADAGERPVRLRLLMAAVEAVLADRPVMLGEGWRLARVRLVRGRIVRSGGGDRWSGSAEFGLRMWRVGEGEWA